MKFLILAFIAISSFGGILSQVTPHMELYTEFECTWNGNNFLANVTRDYLDIDEIREGLLGDAGSSNTGTWITYRRKNYAGNGFVSRHHCIKYSGGPDSFPIQSLRYSGDRDDIDKPTLQFFQDTWYNGADRIYQADERNYPFEKYNSFILSGEEPITIYQEVDFGGKSECISPYWGVRDITDINEMLFWDFYWISPIRSFKFGCHAKTPEKKISPRFSSSQENIKFE